MKGKHSCDEARLFRGTGRNGPDMHGWVLCFKRMSNEESTSGSIRSAKQREVCSRASHRIGARVGKWVSLFILVTDNLSTL